MRIDATAMARLDAQRDHRPVEPEPFTWLRWLLGFASIFGAET